MKTIYKGEGKKLPGEQTFRISSKNIRSEPDRKGTQKKHRFSGKIDVFLHRFG